ncbi:centrosome and spindle pole associated protein 1-like [Hypomesus transpacificus]|uniref:centrosome and spindle pole associated protein 1-like n=1 Tax=Hypomesus transpacificus TaxID=137520 RepID=UPI001F079FDB|nr:centrosome and spindle pole associated protein 1-like [Hypomesus transpacificus]
MRYEKERQTRFQKVQREISPPIPTLQKRHRAPQSTSSPPSMDSRRSTSSMSQTAKNKELVRLAKEKNNKKVEEEEIAAGRTRYEKERQARIQEVRREISPPIPTLQKRHRAPQSTPSPPSMDSKRPTTPMSKGSLSGLQSQTASVPAVRKELRAAGCLPEYEREVLCKLSAIRKKLLKEQKRAEGQMMRSE